MKAGIPGGKDRTVLVCGRFTLRISLIYLDRIRIEN